MEHEHSHSHESHEEHGHGDGEPIIVKKLAPNEMLAQDLNDRGVIAEPAVQGTHPIEKGPSYSHMFGMNSRLTTEESSGSGGGTLTWCRCSRNSR